MAEAFIGQNFISWNWRKYSLIQSSFVWNLFWKSNILVARKHGQLTKDFSNFQFLVKNFLKKQISNLTLFIFSSNTFYSMWNCGCKQWNLTRAYIKQYVESCVSFRSCEMSQIPYTSPFFQTDKSFLSLGGYSLCFSIITTCWNPSKAFCMISDRTVIWVVNFLLNLWCRDAVNSENVNYS